MGQAGAKGYVMCALRAVTHGARARVCERITPWSAAAASVHSRAFGAARPAGLVVQTCKAGCWAGGRATSAYSLL